MAAPETREPSGAWVWWVAGCGGLLLALLCIVPVAAYFVLSPDDAPDGPISPAPAPPVDPTPPIAPTPLIAPTPNPSPVPTPGPLLPPSGSTNPRHVTAVVEEVSGIANVAARDQCTIDVTR